MKDFSRVSELAQTIEFEHKPTLEELLSTVINRDEVEELVKRPVEEIFLTKNSTYKLNRVADSSVVVEKNEQLLLFNPFGVVSEIVVLIFVYVNVNGQQVSSP